MAANPQQCPLNPFVLLQLENKMNLACLREIENHVKSSSYHHPPLKDIVLHGALDGSTPLLVACEQGDFDSVQHIVDVWGVDVGEAANFYNPKGENIRGATPLFVAALKRHVDIVRFLISKGAPVNAITSTEGNSKGDGGITPLQVAVDNKRIELAISWKDFCLEKNVIIVELLLQAGANPSTLSQDGEPMWCFSGLNSIIALINHDIDVNLRDSEGNNILHYWISWASFGNLTIGHSEKFFLDGVQLLLTRGVDLMARDMKGFTPILLAANELSDLDLHSGPILSTQLGILEALLEREEIDAAEKMDAMELAGAHLLLALEPEKAFQYWRRALLLRDNLSHHPKIPLQMTSAGRTEWITREQLENVIRDSSVWYTQSKVAILRIYAGRSFEAVRHSYIGVNSREVEEAVTQTQKSDLLLETLGVSLRFNPNENHFWEHKTSLINGLITILSSTLENDMPLPNVECETIKTFLKLVENLILAVDPIAELPGLRLNYEFFAFLVSVPDLILREEVWKFLSNSARQRDIKGTKLAQACENKDWKTLRFLLHLRANPDETTGSGGNGPLHLVADQQFSSEMECTPASLLFEYGADPYRKNDEGKTAVDIWIERNCGVEGMESPKWKNRPDWCRNTAPKLGCLAAKTIHSHRIPYTRPGVLPVNLIRFLENH